MSDALFHSNMSMDEFAAALEARFRDLSDANTDQIAEIEYTLRRTRGRPVNDERIEQFRLMDRERACGSTTLAAAKTALSEHVNAKPRRRRTRNDLEDEAENLARQYRRHRKRMNDGLNPAIPYSKDMLIELIITKQWSKVSAIFINANRSRREDISELLNNINSRNR